MSISVSIIEDDESVREILVGWVSRTKGFRCLSNYSSVEKAVEHLPADKPDVVLVDINLSGQSGIFCVHHLKPLLPQTQFLMLTVYEDADHIFDALAAGASGYLLKRTPRAELLAAIKQVNEGGSPMTSYIARKVVLSFQPIRSTHPEPNVLSPREREVLELLARGFSYKEITESLGISMPTVNTHIHRIYEKLHVRSRGEAVARYAPRPIHHHLAKLSQMKAHTTPPVAPEAARLSAPKAKTSKP
ncbi:MAG: response regulator transcription factor [Akkermansiaceae bacterium]|nr:response regulator transcription factor [Verrucomicrobiales bacterium]